MGRDFQQLLFPSDDSDDLEPEVEDRLASTFTDNMRLPVHRWFRFSAGFSALWAESVNREHAERHPPVVLDPFAGSGTTLSLPRTLALPATALKPIHSWEELQEPNSPTRPTPRRTDQPLQRQKM